MIDCVRLQLALLVQLTVATAILSEQTQRSTLKASGTPINERDVLVGIKDELPCLGDAQVPSVVGTGLAKILLCDNPSTPLRLPVPFQRRRENTNEVRYISTAEPSAHRATSLSPYLAQRQTTNVADTKAINRLSCMLPPALLSSKRQDGAMCRSVSRSPFTHITSQTHLIILFPN